MNRSLLLDTCALLWLGGAVERLSAEARRMIDETMLVYASPVSLWEVALKCKLGKLELAQSPADWFSGLIRDYNLTVLPMTAEVMLHAAELPFHHRDPADRFIIASALKNDFIVVTGDERFPLYGVRTIV